MIDVVSAVRWLVVGVLSVHGVIHLLGATKGFGWAEIAQLKQPAGPGEGVLWLCAAMFVLATAVMVAAAAPPWWWIVAAVAAIVSQIAIITSWGDAKAGTAGTVVLVLVAAYGFLAEGPVSFHAQWRDQATRAVCDQEHGPPMLTDADLASLPGPVATYVRNSGAVGQPRVVNFHADIRGTIRNGPDSAWMPFTGRQLNTTGPRPQRLFLIDAARGGLPVTVLHSYADSTASMRAKLLSL